MRAEDILFLVQCETQVPWSEMKPENNKRCRNTHILFARYVAITMMIEEDISAIEIAKVFEVDRASIYYTKKTVNDLLKNNRPFKTMYLACIKRMAEMEDAA